MFNLRNIGASELQGGYSPGSRNVFERGEEPAWWQEVLSGYDRDLRHLESKKKSANAFAWFL